MSLAQSGFIRMNMTTPVLFTAPPKREKCSSTAISLLEAGSLTGAHQVMANLFAVRFRAGN